jgi:undecaprenyl-diphosphatase
VGAVIWWRQRRWQSALVAVGWLSIGQLVRALINGAVARPRPPPHLQLVHASGYAFPSGHTTTATVGYGLSAMLIAIALPRARNWAIATAVVLTIIVGLSRVYLGVHWPTDVLGGWVLGVGWLAVGAAIGYAARGARTTDRGGIGTTPARPCRPAPPRQCR